MFRACAKKRAIVAANLPSVLLLCRHIGLLFGKRLDTNLLRQRDSKISGFTRPHVIGFVADLFFSTPGSGFKNIRIRCRIRRMRGPVTVSGKKKLRIQKYPDTCGRDLKSPIRGVSINYCIVLYLLTGLHTANVSWQT